LVGGCLFYGKKTAGEPAVFDQGFCRTESYGKENGGARRRFLIGW
jgi:hypothetical protein